MPSKVLSRLLKSKTVSAIRLKINSLSEMFHLKIFAAFLFVLLSVVLQSRVKSQPTIDSFKENCCPQSEEEWRIEIEDNQRMKLELENELQSLKALGNVSRFQSEENQKLKLELEKERRLVQILRQEQAMVKLIKGIDGLDPNLYRVTKVLDEIYVLCFLSVSNLNTIKVFEDRNGFRLLREIILNGIKWPYDMVYSNESKCFYINDAFENCIWRMTIEDGNQLTKWMTNVVRPHTLSLSNEGHLLMLKAVQPFSQLEIYSLSANLIRTIQLPQDVKDPRHAVQTSDGYYVILHKLTGALNGSIVISQVNSTGHLMNRFIPRNQFQVLRNPLKLFYESDNNRLFVADEDNHRVILFDSIYLNWIQVLLIQETEGIWHPRSVFYDVIERQLLVLRYGTLEIYELL